MVGFLRHGFGLVSKHLLVNGKTVCVLLALSFVLSSCALFRPAPVTWNDTKWCVPPELKRVIRQVALKFGSVNIHSTHRWPAENKRKGGKPKSYHLKCRAVDFSVKGDPSAVLAFIKNHPSVGGYSRYPQGFYHIDNGPKRTW